MGHEGNDLHYRGYDIAEMARQATYEEVAHLLIHERLPSRAELEAYRRRLQSRRGLPAALRAVLEAIPASAHPMDVLRTGCSMLGIVEPEAAAHDAGGARAIADRLTAVFPSMLLYWHHFATSGRRIEVETDDPTIAAHFCGCCTSVRPRRCTPAPSTSPSFSTQSMSSTPPPSPPGSSQEPEATSIPP